MIVMKHVSLAVPFSLLLLGIHYLLIMEVKFTCTVSHWFVKLYSLAICAQKLSEF